MSSTIVVIHGFMDRASDYSHLVRRLRVFGNVIARDAPGHGSPLGRPLAMVDWVDAVVAEVNLHDRVILMGHSAGGHVALAASTAAPERIEAVVTLDTPLLVDREMMLSAPAQGYVASVATDPNFADAVHHVANKDLDSFFKDFSEDATEPPAQCPVLLIGGDPESGSLLTDEHLKYAENRFEDVTSMRLTGLGHGLGIYTDDLDPLIRAVTPFLSAFQSSGPE